MNTRLNSRAWGRLRAEEGKGTAGCLFFLLLTAVALFVGIRVGPDYYSYKGFETDVQTEVSRAGANFADEESVVRNILALARKNEIRLKRENIKMEHFAGKVHVTVKYTVQIDLIVYQRDVDYEVKASSFVGRL